MSLAVSDEIKVAPQTNNRVEADDWRMFAKNPTKLDKSEQKVLDGLNDLFPITWPYVHPPSFPKNRVVKMWLDDGIFHSFITRAEASKAFKLLTTE